MEIGKKNMFEFKVYYVVSTERHADELDVEVQEKGTEDHDGDLMNRSPAVNSL